MAGSIGPSNHQTFRVIPTYSRWKRSHFWTRWWANLQWSFVAPALLCGGAGKATGHQSCNRSAEFPSFFEFGIESLMDLIDHNRFNWHMKATWPENTGYIVIRIYIYILLHYIGYIYIYNITLYRIYYYIIFNGYDSMISNDPGLPQRQDQGRCPLLVAPWHEDATSNDGRDVNTCKYTRCKYCLDEYMDIYIYIIYIYLSKI